VTPSDAQGFALRSIHEWHRVPRGRQEYYLAGFAGTGKSTIAGWIVRDMDLRSMTATYTGKAASVLRRKGVDASTIHSLIYTPIPDSDPVEFVLNEESALIGAGLLILDECFIGDTLIDTPNGLVKICDIFPGDTIINASGIDHVAAISKKRGSKIAQINVGSTTLTCSEDHRFFTERGLVSARDLRLGEQITSTTEAMRLLWNGIYSEEELSSKILSEWMWNSMARSIFRMEESLYERKNGKQHLRASYLEEQSRRSIASSLVEKRRFSTDAESRNCKKSGKNENKKWLLCENTCWRERSWPDKTTSCSITNSISTFCDGTFGESWTASSRLSDGIQTGLSRSYKKNWNRDQWLVTSNSEWYGERSKEDWSLDGTRVDHIEFLEQGDPRLDRFRDADGFVYLYDIQAERHHSYSVEGLLVHNCSMVSNDIAADLRSFGVKMLVIGDPGQLPPIRGTGAFTSREPDTLLTEIHRQAAESPILRLATMARCGEHLPLGEHGEGVTVRRYDRADVLRPDHQIICGTHRTRWALTAVLRETRGVSGLWPRAGEPVICCRNDREAGLYNGMMGICVQDSVTTGDDVMLFVRMDDESTTREILASTMLFREHDARSSLPPERWRRGVQLFDFGYVLTCHKAAGSEWESVIVVDESRFFREDRSKWIYTAITRASNELTILV
jgi:UvrD-like helicase family protein/AAA domain-containing protein